VLDNLLPLIWETQPDRFPLAGGVLDLATCGLIVHSRYVQARVRAAGYQGPVWRIPHPAWPEERVAPAEVHGDPLVGCFGHQNMNKRIPQLLEAFTLVRRRRPGARLLLVGIAAERFDLDRRLERLGIGGEALIREGYVSEERLSSLMAACDVLVNLRSPTMGETSGSVIRGLALGKAMIVSDVGWFAELPDGVALRVPVDEYEVPTLAAALELAAAHRAELGEAARAYVAEVHDLGRAADSYVGALEQAAGGEAVADAVLRRLAEAAADAGIDDPRLLVQRAREAGIV
jgi:glycosyltransferase involved in cell wall biosynthesis